MMSSGEALDASPERQEEGVIFDVVSVAFLLSSTDMLLDLESS